MYFAGSELPPPQLLRRLNDAHCHPTTAMADPGAIEALRSVGIGSLVAMSTMADDQQEVEDLARSDPSRVVPAFGFHPWATHAIALDPSTSRADHYASVFLTPSSSSAHRALLDELLEYLPTPTPLGTLLPELEARLRRWPRAQLGEVGLDKNARVPFPPAFRAHAGAGASGEPIPKEDKLGWLRSRALSPFATSLEHQTAVLQAQVGVLRAVVADERRPRGVSMHAVGVSAPVERLLSGWEREWKGLPAGIRVLLHSCGLSWEAWQIIERKTLPVYLSISPLLLSAPEPTADPSRPATIALLFARARPDRILIESDQSDVTQSARALWAVVRALAAGRSWDADQGAWEALDEDAKVARVVDVVGANYAAWVGPAAEGVRSEAR